MRQSPLVVKKKVEIRLPFENVEIIIKALNEDIGVLGEMKEK